MHCSTSLQVCYVNDVAADLDRDCSTSGPPATAASALSIAAVTQRPHPKPDVIPKSISEVVHYINKAAAILVC